MSTTVLNLDSTIWLLIFVMLLQLCCELLAFMRIYLLRLILERVCPLLI
jgi:hypothetical protein